MTDFIFLGSKITGSDCSHEIKRCLPLGRKAMTNLDSIIKKQRHHFANRGPSSQSYGFSSSHIWMWYLEHRESWAPKNWCLWTVVLEKALKSPLVSKEITPVNPKEINPNTHWKDWNWSSNNLATWCEVPTHQKRPWCWERLRAGGEGGVRGWDDWIALLTQWIWIWANSGS